MCISRPEIIGAQDQQLTLISELFRLYCVEQSDISPPIDFLELSILVMKHLHSCGRSNVLYHLAKALGTVRNGENESLIPVRRIPLELTEH